MFPPKLGPIVTLGQWIVLTDGTLQACDPILVSLDKVKPPGKVLLPVHLQLLILVLQCSSTIEPAQTLLGSHLIPEVFCREYSVPRHPNWLLSMCALWIQGEGALGVTEQEKLCAPRGAVAAGWAAFPVWMPSSHQLQSRAPAEPPSVNLCRSHRLIRARGELTRPSGLGTKTFPINTSNPVPDSCNQGLL